MPIPFEEILGSEPFRFYVGPDERCFHVHSQLIASLSDYLHSLLKGPMAEGQQGQATCPEVDEQTFIKFSQFAYTGDYTPADTEMLLAGSDVDVLAASRGQQSQAASLDPFDSAHQVLEYIEHTSDFDSMPRAYGHPNSSKRPKKGKIARQETSAGRAHS